eukprot:scaffold6322_cov59-Cylindrotheca_fusiformis.AAC.18
MERTKKTRMMDRYSFDDNAVGELAFHGCEKLKCILYQGLEKEEVGFPSNVRAIDDCAFEQCILLKTLVHNEGQAWNDLETALSVDTNL